MGHESRGTYRIHREWEMSGQCSDPHSAILRDTAGDSKICVVCETPERGAVAVKLGALTQSIKVGE